MENIKDATKASLSYMVWFFTSLWRCKTSFLAAVGLIGLVFVCLQFNVTKELIEIALSKQDIPEEAVRLVAGQKNHLQRELYLSYENPAADETGHNNEVEFITNANTDNERRISFEVDDKKISKELPYIPKCRLVHFDLKGAPPKPSYLQKLFSLIKELGATGILLEWEDMFPWEDKLETLAAKNAFSRTEAKEIVTSAVNYKLEIIPVIQTFGHMEFVLKNKEFAHLREVTESPQALCPSLNSSFELVKEMIDQVMQIHPNIKFLHIGCDEVFHLGECPLCHLKMRDDLFLSHVTRIAQYIRSKYISVVPIMWDDMLRHVPLSTLELYKINNLVEPMVWVYAEDVYRFVPQSVWEKYQKIFPYVWSSSSFKGAFGETLYVPNVKRHLENNMNWLTLMNIEDSKFEKGFRGIAITGWQRYDHFATLCEILPAAIPSLVVNLAVVSHGYANNSLKEKIYKALDCSVMSSSRSYMQNLDQRGSFLNLDNDPFLWDQFSSCMFSGNRFYKLLYRWHNLRREIRLFVEAVQEKRAWLTDYNIRRNYSIPFRIDEIMSEHSRMYRRLLSMVESVNDALKEIFDKYTVAEWIEQNLYPSVVVLEKIQNACRTLKSIHTWPQRPLPPLNDLQRLGVSVLSNSSRNRHSEMAV